MARNVRKARSFARCIGKRSVKKGRFAPSPSGRMHLGNIYTALISWLSCRTQNAHWLLRIEDLDTQRCKPQYASLVMEDLHWLGLDWDEGPRSLTDKAYFQSARNAFYERAFETLTKKSLVYDCFCTREALLASSAPHCDFPQYAGTCKQLTQEENAALRKIRIPAKRMSAGGFLPPHNVFSFTDGFCGEQKCALTSPANDFIIRRADNTFSYQLAVTVDDALMGVTEVVRGDDLRYSTFLQLYLYTLLGFTPPTFFHIPLLRAKDGTRLSKRNKSQSMEFLREQYTPQDIIGTIMFQAGFLLQEEPLSLTRALEIFSWHSFSPR